LPAAGPCMVLMLRTTNRWSHAMQSWLMRVLRTAHTGFGNNTTDYVKPFGKRELALKTQLEQRGWHVEVVQIARTDW